jgi:hypothetical protein
MSFREGHLCPRSEPTVRADSHGFTFAYLGIGVLGRAGREKR